MNICEVYYDLWLGIFLNERFEDCWFMGLELGFSVETEIPDPDVGALTRK